MSKNYCKVEHKWCKFCKKTDEGFCCTFNKELYKSLKNIHKCPKRESRETVSFRALLKAVNLYDVMTEMLKSHPNEKKNILGYAQVYTELVNKKGIKSDGMLRCKTTYWEDHNNPGIKKPCIDIYGVWGKKEYAIEFVPWGEWLTMNIEHDTIMNYTKEQIVAAALWEMTFNGYTEADVFDKAKQLETAFDECLNK